MNEQNMQGQMSLGRLNTPVPTEMDDLAALLGIMTTFGEQHHIAMQPQQQAQTDTKPQDASSQLQQQQKPAQTHPEASKQPQETSKEQKAEDDRDAAMQKEIEDIRAELEKLKQEENDTTGTTTEDTQPAS